KGNSDDLVSQAYYEAREKNTTKAFFTSKKSGLAAMSWAVLNAYRKFSVAAASPALLNIAILFAAIILAPLHDNPAEALAVGVILGGVLQLAIQFPALKRIGWIPKPTWRPRLPAIHQTLLLFGPAVLGIAAVQINILVGTILATLLPTGAVSYLYYADRIVQLPLALFGIAIGTALLPTLSEHLANGRKEEARQDLKQGLTWLTWIILPAIVGIMFLAEPIIRTLFEQGKFTATDSANTAHALQAYGVGLMAFCWARVLSTACFAGKDAKAPMKYAIYTVIVNIILAVILMQSMSYVGLALATALASFFNVGLLWSHMHRKQGAILDLQSGKRMFSAAIACIPMAAALYYMPQVWLFPADKMMQFVWLGSMVTLSMAAFFISAWVLGEHKLLKRG
ncbi:MAG TPA: murein biosynthesis integral membrane protein MurJ, partial [Ghiorsea sp.]|nr:murein biosynthesis integral membrane protein MurJ [Ghiorsea sp.]